MQTGQLVRKLPNGLTQQIGAAIIAYAQLEHLLSSIIHMVLDVTHQEGRLAVRAPRSPDRFMLLADLIALYDLKPKANLTELAKRIADCHRQRDQLAHGVWIMSHPKSHLVLRLTKGTWQPINGQRGKTKRLINPEGVQFGEHDAKALVDFIDKTNDQIIALGVEIQTAIRPSLKKFPSRSATPGRTPDRTT